MSKYKQIGSGPFYEAPDGAVVVKASTFKVTPEMAEHSMKANAFADVFADKPFVEMSEDELLQAMDNLTGGGTE